MRFSIIDNQSDFLTIWQMKDNIAYKLNGAELHQLTIFAINDIGAEFPPGISKEKKKEIYSLISTAAQRLSMGERAPTKLIYQRCV